MNAENIRTDMRNFKRLVPVMPHTIDKKTKKYIVSLRNPVKLKEISQVLSIESMENIKKAKIGHFEAKFKACLGPNNIFNRQQKMARPIPSEVKELYIGKKKIIKASE